MRTIEIDDDIYAHLLAKTSYVGESLGSIVRRELKLADGTTTRERAPLFGRHELSTFLSSPKMKFGNTTDKFLNVLAEAHRQKPAAFERVLAIQGRDRLYFARSQEEISRSGRSTQPLQIPGTEYWVMTNSPTQQKKKMLHDALELLGFTKEARIAAVQAIS